MVYVLLDFIHAYVRVCNGSDEDDDESMDLDVGFCVGIGIEALEEPLPSLEFITRQVLWITLEIGGKK